MQLLLVQNGPEGFGGELHQATVRRPDGGDLSGVGRIHGERARRRRRTQAVDLLFGERLLRARGDLTDPDLAPHYGKLLGPAGASYARGNAPLLGDLHFQTDSLEPEDIRQPGRQIPQLALQVLRLRADLLAKPADKADQTRIGLLTRGTTFVTQLLHKLIVVRPCRKL